ncbi:hypothetical protein [Streptomyces sp. NPDC001843]|uniref:hypothetical protein n=1 Tax=Streptomyces sp. NPDC001843 TaxID=3364617 RepID=UPI0036948172
MIFESLEASVPCEGCGGVAEWHGVQALVDDSLRWDTEVSCRTCGHALAVCGGELPASLRERMLGEHGRTVLRLGAPVRRVVVMRVLRKTLGVGLAEAGDVLDRVLAGRYGATLPETELLARRLRSAGVEAEAVGPASDEFGTPQGSPLL